MAKIVHIEPPVMCGSKYAVLLAALGLLLFVCRQRALADYNNWKATSYYDGPVTAVEDSPNGLYVSTTDRNYALIGVKNSSESWSSVSVNEDEVLITLADNTTLSTTYHVLSENKREFVSELRANFAHKLSTLGLNGLKQYSTSRAAKMFRSTQKKVGRNAARQLDYPTGAYLSPVLNQAPPTFQSDDHSESCISNNNFNYYNLHQLLQPKEREKFGGDVYQFGPPGVVREIYSGDVTVEQNEDQHSSILYRDHAYFSYSGRALSTDKLGGIARLFLNGQYAIFVYNNATVLVKPNWLVDENEFYLVKRAREEVKLRLKKSQQLREKITEISTTSNHQNVASSLLT